MARQRKSTGGVRKRGRIYWIWYRVDGQRYELLDEWRRIGFPKLFRRHRTPSDPIVPSRADGRGFRSATST